MTAIAVAALAALSPLLLWWSSRNPYRHLERALALREKMADLPTDVREAWQVHLTQVMAEAMAAREPDAIEERARYHRLRTAPLVFVALFVLCFAVVFWLVAGDVADGTQRLGMQAGAVLAGVTYIWIIAVTWVGLQARQQVTSIKNARRGLEVLRHRLSADVDDFIPKARANSTLTNQTFQEKLAELERRQRSLNVIYGDLYGDSIGEDQITVEVKPSPTSTRPGEVVARKRSFLSRVVGWIADPGSSQVKKPPGDSKP